MTDRARPGLVALYDIRPRNGAGQFLQPRSPHGAHVKKLRRMSEGCINIPRGPHAACGRSLPTSVHQSCVRLVSWCFTALSAQIAYIMPQQ